ncbi:hypothetical protein [Maritimibacter dapengensis]|uniref:PH domain-containing protein n=1 Tax=Maritimibacter dapengensis TaxID=2836868 RepID=A0ABS6SZH3_9RHOB|nr:hypothetical protein [Maritimibacter dapengensis]MBV7378385.1 hypothetical protein [Maritimibacter dapengensis]
MNMVSGDLDFDLEGIELEMLEGIAEAEATPWGYIVNGGAEPGQSPLRTAGARFIGAILMLAGAGLWMVPDSTYGAEIFAMKLSALVLFVTFGGALVWFGRNRPGLEVQVDTSRQELRIGQRTISGKFKLLDMLRFGEVGSVYLMRNGAQGKPSRLYLRVGQDGSTGIEILRGSQRTLERLRLKLLDDLSSARHV